MNWNRLELMRRSSEIYIFSKCLKFEVHNMNIIYIYTHYIIISTHRYLLYNHHELTICGGHSVPPEVVPAVPGAVNAVAVGCRLDIHLGMGRTSLVCYLWIYNTTGGIIIQPGPTGYLILGYPWVILGRVSTIATEKLEKLCLFNVEFPHQLSCVDFQTCSFQDKFDMVWLCAWLSLLELSHTAEVFRKILHPRSFV